MFPITAGRGFLAGFHNLTVTNDLIAGGIVRGNILEFVKTHAIEPGVRHATETNNGIGLTSSGIISLLVGASAPWRAQVLAAGNSAGSHSMDIAGTANINGVLTMASRTVDIPAVNSTVALGAPNVELTLSAGSIVSTAAPFILAGLNGQVLVLTNVHATNTLTLATNGGTATNLRLRAATRVLAAGGGYLALRYRTSLGLWCEEGFE